MEEQDLLYLIRGAIYDTYNALGPGICEELCEDVLVHFLKKRGLKVDRQVRIPVIIDGEEMHSPLRLDLLVEDQIIIELKSVRQMDDIFFLQLLTYLRLTHLHRGVLVNFNTKDINSSIWYKVNSRE